MKDFVFSIKVFENVLCCVSHSEHNLIPELGSRESRNKHVGDALKLPVREVIFILICLYSCKNKHALLFITGDLNY